MQATVALSTCEAEYYMIVHAAKEIVWIKRLITEAGWAAPYSVPLRSDSQSTSRWATEQRCPSGQAKHKDVSVFYLRGLIKEKAIALSYVCTQNNAADVLTKPLHVSTLNAAPKHLDIAYAARERC